MKRIVLAMILMAAAAQGVVNYFSKQKVTAKNDPTDLLNRINKQHGTHTIDWAEKIGLGSRQYVLISIDR